MSARFRIHKDDDGYHLPWKLTYPDGFDDISTGEDCQTFDLAVGALIEAAQRQCPTCARGDVVDTDFGWKCTTGGSYDVAVGHPPPPPCVVTFCDAGTCVRGERACP
jgi:hypothetical protein